MGPGRGDGSLWDKKGETMINRILLAGACSAALLTTTPVWAQQTGADPASVEEPQDDDGAANLEELVVTGSRIIRDGYQAPTPVTVRSAEDLQVAAPLSVISGLAQLPQFAQSSLLTESRRFQNPNVPTGNYLNLRGIGSVRTLNLLNGVRLPATNYLGQVDATIVPQLLLERVDVVTGGASAAYGSDAVAGVVNFVLDTDFTGVKNNAQAGATSKGDRFNYRLGLAGGFALGEKGHVLLGYDRAESDEVMRKDREPTSQKPPIGVAAKYPGPGAGTPANPFIYVYDARYNLPPSAYVSSGPFLNTYFPTVGTFRPIQGTPTNTPGINVGGDWDIQTTENTLVTPALDQTFFARGTLAITDELSAYVQGLYSESENDQRGLNIPLRNISIFSGNPYLPSAFQQQMTTQNVSSVLVGRQLKEFGSLTVSSASEALVLSAGIQGSLFDRFTWNLDYVHGDTRFKQDSKTVDLTRLAAAVDAVRDPNGNIVCRVSLTSPGRYPGCVPLNLLGIGAPSAEAIDYVTGVSKFWTRYKSDILSASMRGDLFSLPAGKVSVAAGAEHREEALSQKSNSNPGIPVDITGLRGIAASTTRYYLVNPSEAQGSVRVKEAFAEIVVPILKEQPFARSLDLNGAVRYTDYSTSGEVTTWKVGLGWEPLPDVRVRATRSHDIRAPNINELFAGKTSSFFPIIDPHTTASTNVAIQGGGNPDLKPEIADTTTIGLVFQPRSVPGLSLSVDRYQIKISDVIGSISISETLSLCEASNGTSPVCDLIVRPLPFSDRSTANAPTLIHSKSINIADRVYEGVDVEATYRTSLSDADLTVRLLGTYVDSIRTRATPTSPVLENVGYLSTPRVTATLSVRYDRGIWSLYVQERMYGKVKLGSPVSVFDERDPPALYYTDLTISARPEFAAAYGGEFFLTVNNLFDPRPFTSVIEAAGGGIGNRAFEGRYDFVGRSFTTGVRARF